MNEGSLSIRKDRFVICI